MIRQRKIVSKLNKLTQIYRDYRDSGFNETETCEYLINGLLNALGWDTTDPSIGRREDRTQTADSDVYADYSFFDRRCEPNERSTARVRVFVEAKRVSRGLGVDAQGMCHDNPTKKWLEQVAFYGVLKGARWLILTNGHQLALFRPSQDGDSLYAQGQLVFQSFEEMLARVNDLLLLSRESVWSEHIDQVLDGQQATRHQIPTPRTRVRALFEANDLHVFFDDKAADFAVADYQAPITPDPLFYQGVNASWENILADQDVIRPKLIDKVFRTYYFNSNICIVRSESGQGKTTLMFRFAYEYRDLFYVLELCHLTLSDVRLCELGIRNLTELHKPILILVDDITRKQGWANFLRAAANMRHIYILATSREDEWAQIDVRGIESRIAFVSPELDYETARLIYDGITSKGLRKTKDSFQSVFSQSKKRLLEFVTLTTQGGHLEAILDAQVSNLSTQDPQLLTVLRFVSFFHTLGLSVDVETLGMTSGMSQPTLIHLLDQLRGEFVSRMADGIYEGLHELRSRVITDILHSRFFTFDDTLNISLEYAAIGQFETLIKNLSLLGEDIWDRSEIEKVFTRLRMISDPVTLIQCVRAFNESARRKLSNHISELIQYISDGLIKLDPNQFILGLHRTFGSSFKWKSIPDTDKQILRQIPIESLVSKASQALPFHESNGEKNWQRYEHLVEWSEVVGVVAIAREEERFVENIVQFLGEYGEDDLNSFATWQTDFMGLLTPLEVVSGSIHYSEILNTWLNLDWDDVFCGLSWDEQKGIIERVVELEEALYFENWRDRILDSMASSLVGWDPPDAMLDLLDEIEAVDERLAEELKEHPEVIAEHERIDEWRSEAENKRVQDSNSYELDELVALSAEDIADKLTEISPGMAVKMLERLEARFPEKLSLTVGAIGVDGLKNIGQACQSSHEVESFIFSIAGAGRAHLSDVCQAMKVRDSDLIIAKARMQRGLEG